MFYPKFVFCFHPQFSISDFPAKNEAEAVLHFQKSNSLSALTVPYFLQGLKNIRKVTKQKTHIRPKHKSPKVPFSSNPGPNILLQDNQPE